MARPRVLVGVAALWAAAALPAAAAPAVIVRVNADVTVQHDEVRVADLAAVEGEEPLATRARGLRVGPAPVAGTTQRLEGEPFRMRLRALLGPRVEVVVPERVAITRAFQLVPGSALVEAVRRQALARLTGAAEGEAPGALAIVPVSRPDDLRVPTGDVALEARVPDVLPGSAFLTAAVLVRVNGRDLHTVPLTFRVGHYQQVVVAARPLSPAAALGAVDFRLEQRVSTEVPPDALAVVEGAADLEALRPIKGGEIVTTRSVRPKLLVKRGDLVTLVLEGAGFRITTQGQAREDARRGDTVRVTNVASRRDVLGRVESAGVVRVPLMTAPRSQP